MNDFIDFVVKHQKGHATTASGINYLIMPRDFHPMAQQIPYFAIGDAESNIFAISEDVPEIFRSVWVMHEEKCVQNNCSQCVHLTWQDIRKVRTLFFNHEYQTFLEMRLAMYQAILAQQPQSEMWKYWEQSTIALTHALSRL